jgi:hypothetical protein
MVRRFLVLTAALVAALAVSATAQAATVTFTSPFSSETETLVGDGNGNGVIDPGDTLRISGELLNPVAQFGRSAGALVGAWMAEVTFISERLAQVRGFFTYPRLGRIVVGGSFDPMGSPSGLYARSLSGTIDGQGTLDVVDTADASLFVFTFPWERFPFR